MEKMNDMMTPGVIAYILKRVIFNSSTLEACKQ